MNHKTLAFCCTLLCSLSTQAHLIHPIEIRDATGEWQGAKYISHNQYVSLELMDSELNLLRDGKRILIETIPESGDRIHDVNAEFLIVNTSIGAVMNRPPFITRIDQRTGQISTVEYDYVEIPGLVQNRIESKEHSDGKSLAFTCFDPIEQPQVKYHYRYENGKMTWLNPTMTNDRDALCRSAYDNIYLVAKQENAGVAAQDIVLPMYQLRAMSGLMDHESFTALVKKPERYSFNRFQQEYCDD